MSPSAKSTLSFVTVLLACPALARDKTDVLVLTNGDRITCEIKKLEGGVLSVNLDYVDGTVAINWLKVARVESSALFRIRMTDGSIYAGALKTPADTAAAASQVGIQPVDTHETVLVDRSDVVQMTQTAETHLQRMSGSVTIGAMYSKGNNTTQFNLASDVGYQETKWGAAATYASNLSSSSGAPVSTRNQIGLSAFRLMPWNNYFYSGAADFLQSSVQGIRLQTSLSAGVGRYLKNTDRARWTVVGALGWLKTTYVSSASAPQSAQNVGVAIITSTFQGFRFKKTHLDAEATIVPALTDPGRLFFKTNAAYYLKLFGEVDWNLSLYGNWDTQPPPHFKGSDYGTSIGLSWNFGPNR